MLREDKSFLVKRIGELHIRIMMERSALNNILCPIIGLVKLECLGYLSYFVQRIQGPETSVFR